MSDGRSAALRLWKLKLEEKRAVREAEERTAAREAQKLALEAEQKRLEIEEKKKQRAMETQREQRAMEERRAKRDAGQKTGQFMLKHEIRLVELKARQPQPKPGDGRIVDGQTPFDFSGAGNLERKWATTNRLPVYMLVPDNYRTVIWR